MILRIAFFITLSALFSSCASGPGLKSNSRNPAQAASNFSGEEEVALPNIYSMQRSYWSDKRKGNDYFGRYSAFVVKSNDEQAEHARVIIYLEDPNDSSKMVKVADNSNYVWAGGMAGTEPNLGVNGRGSLMIVQGNDGIGRSVWQKSITVRVLANTGKIEVIGYDYSDYDRQQEDPSRTCSYNFLNGAANSSTTPPNKPTQKNKVKGIKGTVDLNNWTEANEPTDCLQ